MSDDTRAAAEALFSAVIAGDAKSLMGLIHPESVALMHRSHVDFLRSAAMTAEAHPRTRPQYQKLISSYGIRSPDELEAMTPIDFVAAVLELEPRMIQGLSFEIVDVVREGSDQAHILYRMRWSAEEPPQRVVHTATLKRAGDQWCLTVDPWNPWILQCVPNRLFAADFDTG